LTTGTIGKKILGARKEIPYIIDRGEKETGAERFPERTLENGKVHGVSVKDLIAKIKEKTGGKPFKPPSVPCHLQSRPRFVG